MQLLWLKLLLVLLLMLLLLLQLSCNSFCFVYSRFRTDAKYKLNISDWLFGFGAQS